MNPLTFHIITLIKAGGVERKMNTTLYVITMIISQNGTEKNYVWLEFGRNYQNEIMETHTQKYREKKRNETNTWLAFPFTLNIHHPTRCRLTMTNGFFANRFGPQAFSPNKWQTIDLMQHQALCQQSYRDSVRPTLGWFRCSRLSRSFYLQPQPIPVVRHNLRMNGWRLFISVFDYG